MREWHLTAADPMAPRIAADARAGRTDYHDDQTWQLRLGKPDEPAISLETRYGGRVGLARLLPIWHIGRRQVYETQGYHRPPVLTAFAPDYLRLEADLTIAINLTLEYWVMESRAVGGRFTCRNTGSQPQNVRLDMIAQAVRENESLQMYFLTLQNGQVALQMGKLRHLAPILLVEGATAESSTKARLGRVLALEPGAEVTVRWVMAGLSERDASLLLAHEWLSQPDWDASIAAVEQRTSMLPHIETGRSGWDEALAWSQQLALRCFLSATGNLPHPSFVESRKPNQGFAAGGAHSGGFRASWGGQTVPDALLIAPTVALAAPELAKGIVRNFLAVQRDDGWIDAKPGLDSQRANVLAPPLLATLAYTVYHYTGDKAFLGECLDGLLAFFDRWFQKDVDRDRDGLPEWSDPEQGAFGDGPTFAQGRRWGAGVDVTTVEAPDLAAYLVREASTLIKIAGVLDRDDVEAEITPQYEALQAHLNAMWDDEAGVFHYRDRDTHGIPAGELVYDGKGDQPFRDKTVLPTPSRLILRISGGLSRKPNLSCTIEGVDEGGKSTHEDIPAEAFDWYRGMGSATTGKVWREVHNLTFHGLSRVYKIEVSLVDLSRHDQALLIPLWSGALSDEQVERTVALLTDPDRYWRAYGVAGCPATDPDFDAAHRNGCGGAWPFWNTLIAWALMDLDRTAEAADLFERLLNAQLRSLREEQTFRAFYNPDTGEGLGDSDVVSGVVSLAWFARLFGAYVLGPDRVALGGPFVFEGAGMTWTQHGVRVQRDHDGTQITFPTGHTVDLPPDAEPQVVRDPSAKAAPRQKPAAKQADEPPIPSPFDGLLPDED